MASDFVKKKAVQSRARVDKAYGEKAYGGSAWQEERKRERARKTADTVDSRHAGDDVRSETVRLGGKAHSASPKSAASSYLRGESRAQTFIPAAAAQQAPALSPPQQAAPAPSTPRYRRVVVGGRPVSVPVTQIDSNPLTADARAAGIENAARQASYSKQNPLSVLAHNTGAGLSTIENGFYNAVDFLLPDVLTPQPVQNFIDSAKQNSADIQERVRGYNYDKGGKVGGFVGDLYHNGIAMLPQAVTALLTGGVSETAQGVRAISDVGKGVLRRVGGALAKNPAALSSFASTVGTDYEDAKAGGASELTAAVTAIVGSAINAGIEVGSGIETLTGKPSGWRGVLQTAGEEGAEEVKQGIVSALTQKGIYDTDKPWYSATEDAVINPARMVQEYAGGALLGGVISGGHAVFGASGEKARRRAGVASAEERAQFTRYYQAGRAGIPQEKVPVLPTKNRISPAAAYAAYVAGQNDAAAESHLQTDENGGTMEETTQEVQTQGTGQEPDFEGQVGAGTADVQGAARYSVENREDAGGSEPIQAEDREGGRRTLDQQERLSGTAKSVGEQAGHDGAQYKIKKADDGQPFVEVTEQGLTGIPRKDVPKALSQIVRDKFTSWVDVSGQKIGINARTVSEWARSKDAESLYSLNTVVYTDKMNAFGHADELLQASKDYVGEGLKHVRKDNFIEFARGKVKFKVGENGYEAEVIVGVTRNQIPILYDIINLNSIKITEAPYVTTATQSVNNHRYDTSVTDSILPTNPKSNTEIGENIPDEQLSLGFSPEDIGRSAKSAGAQNETKGVDTNGSDTGRTQGTPAALYRGTGAEVPGGGNQAGGAPTYEGFLAEAQRSGKETGQAGKVIWSYTRTPDADITDSARRASAILRDRYGIESTVHNNDFSVFDGTSTRQTPMEAQTAPSGAIFIANNTKMSAEEIAGHEKIHYIARTSPESIEDFYQNAIFGNMNLDNSDLNDAIETIGRAYLGENFDITDPKDAKKIFEELSAYISGWRDVDAGTTQSRYVTWFQDNAAVEDGYRQLDEMLEQRRNGGSGRNPSSAGAAQSGDAHAAVPSAGAQTVAPNGQLGAARAGISDDVRDALRGRDARLLDAMARATGVRVELAPSIKGGAANGYYDKATRTIYLAEDADAPLLTVAKHELTHHLQEIAPESYASFRDYAARLATRDDNYALSAVQALQQAYARQGVELTTEEALDEMAADFAGELLTDEAAIRKLIADDRTLAQKFFDALRDFIDRIKSTHGGGNRTAAQGAQERSGASLAELETAQKLWTELLSEGVNAQKNTATEGGKERFSLNSQFAKQLDAWMMEQERNPKAEGGNLYVGTTSDALLSIGVDDYKIYWKKAKIKKILMKHQGMTADVIKCVPNILEHPVLVMQSKTVLNSITLLGETYSADGEPIMVALQLRPENKRGEIMEFGVISSAYERTIANTQQLVDQSDILYINPDTKRTNTWLESLRLQLPSEWTKYGSIGTVAQFTRDVNGAFALDKTNSEKAKTEMQIALEKAMAVKEKPSDKFSLKGDHSLLQKNIRAYGAIERGETPARDVQLPKQVDDVTHVRRFARTAAEAAVLDDTQANAIAKAVLDGTFSYEPIGDKSALAHAEHMMARGGAAALDQWNSVVYGANVATKNEIALGESLLRQAAEARDTERVVQLAAEIAAEGTRAGQVVQAMRLLKKMGGAGKLVSLDATLRKMQHDLNKQYKNDAPFLKVPEKLREKLADAQSAEEADAVMDEIYTVLAQQLPSTWEDKWNAWRYLSMLGNPRTHVRNVLGNAVFEPAVMLKNMVGASLEGVVSRVQRAAGIEEIERSKSIRAVLPKTGGAAARFATSDFSEIRDIISGGGKMNPSDVLRERKTIFKNRIPEWLRKQNFNAMEREDGIFLEHQYVRALTQYLIANKIDIDTLSEAKNAALLDRARMYAIKEAQKATYRDFSAAAHAISVFSRNAPLPARLLVEGVLPFKKTPINILKRGIEYSPVGLANALTRGVHQLRTGSISANEFIDKLSAGLTGSGIAAMGYLLASLGLLAGGGDNDREGRFLDQMGAQTYAVTIGDKSYTIDWIAPSSMPLFVGAEVANLVQGESAQSMRAWKEAMMNLAEPMTQMSMLDGINRSIKSVRQGDSPLSDMAINAMISFGTQGVPTLLGQIARTIDGTRRTYYDDKNSGITSTTQKTMQQVANKLPGASVTSPAYLDVWGRKEQNENVLSRALQNFVSPGYFSRSSLGAMEEELLRLYRELGDDAALPPSYDKYFEVGGKRKDLTAAEYEKYAETRGQTAYGVLSELTAKAAYQSMADEDKLRAVSDTYQLANGVAKAAVSQYQPDGWQADAIIGAKKHNISLARFVLARSETVGIESLCDRNGDSIANSKGLQIMEAINDMPGLREEQRIYLYDALGVGKKVSGYNRTLVKHKLAEMRRKAA